MPARNKGVPALDPDSPKGRVSVIQPWRGRIMGSSIPASLSEADANDRYHQVNGPLAPHSPSDSDRDRKATQAIAYASRLPNLRAVRSFPPTDFSALTGEPPHRHFTEPRFGNRRPALAIATAINLAIAAEIQLLLRTPIPVTRRLMMLDCTP